MEGTGEGAGEIERAGETAGGGGETAGGGGKTAGGVMADSEVASLLGRSEERGGFWLGTGSSAGGGPRLSSLESEGGDE